MVGIQKLAAHYTLAHFLLLNMLFKCLSCLRAIEFWVLCASWHLPLLVLFCYIFTISYQKSMKQLCF